MKFADVSRGSLEFRGKWFAKECDRVRILHQYSAIVIPYACVPRTNGKVKSGRVNVGVIVMARLSALKAMVASGLD